MELRTHIDDPRLRRVRRLSIGLRVAILAMGAMMGTVWLLAFVGVGWAGFEGPSGYRLTLVDFEVHTRGEFTWQDLTLLVFWVPLLALGVAIFHQVERLLAAYQRGVILVARNARRISRIGLFIVVMCLCVALGDVLRNALSASLGVPGNDTIVFNLPWFLAGLMFHAIGHAMGIACEIAEDAELTV
ncbi:MAG: DUF2975 domain-containing protein [Gammaproteobacteria bacterium]|nr:DUF2975 domain-containing protein [Gammaproteobacteria bacterium]